MSMKQDVVEKLSRNLSVPRRRRGAIAREIRSHVEETRLELVLSGWQPGEAEEEAVRRLGDTDDIAQAFGEVYRPSRRTQLGLAVALATGMILGVYGIGGGLASATVARKHQSHMVQARTH